MKTYNTTFVTSFFDIGRSDWTVFSRSTEKYLEYFSKLLKLKNNFIVITSIEIAELIKPNIIHDNVEFIILDLDKEYGDLLLQIKKVQTSKEYVDQVFLKMCMEYSDPKYVLVNINKIRFVNLAISKNLVKTEYCAWIDFGYVRDNITLNNIEGYEHSKNSDKINMFYHSIPKKPIEFKVEKEIFKNSSYIMGGTILGKKELWKNLEKIYYDQIDYYLAKNLIDDDQIYYLICYLNNPDIFELTKTENGDWFPFFK